MGQKQYFLRFVPIHYIVSVPCTIPVYIHFCSLYHACVYSFLTFVSLYSLCLFNIPIDVELKFYTDLAQPSILWWIRKLKPEFFDRFLFLFPETYLNLSRTSTMELFCGSSYWIKTFNWVLNTPMITATTIKTRSLSNI